MRRRNVVTALVALLALVFAAGCGGGKGTKVAVVATPQGIVSAASRTADAKTGRLAMTITTAAADKNVTISGDGAFDDVQHRYSLSMDLRPLFAAAPGGAGPFSSMLDSPIEVVGTADTVFIHFPLFARLLGVSTEWISVAASSTGSSSFAADPSAFLDFLRGAGGTVTEQGHENVRGVDTTHLHGTIRLRDALNAAPADQRDRLQHALGQLGQNADALLDQPMPVDVFIGDDGLVRRMTISFAAPAGTPGNSATATVTIEFFDFGADVSITPPPADQVTDATAKFGQLTGGIGGR